LIRRSPVQGEVEEFLVPASGSRFTNGETLNRSERRGSSNNLNVELIFSLLERKYDVPLIEAEYKFDAVAA